MGILTQYGLDIGGIDDSLIVKIGNTPLTTTATDLSSAINELNSNKANIATTLSGYGITDAKIENGTITLGENTIIPLISHQTVTDNNPTLSWGTKSKVATIGDTEINVTMPSNPNTNTTYTIATGDSNGQIKVTPSSGSAYNVGVKGLGSAAYINASTAATANAVAQRQGNGYLYATYYNQSSGAESMTTSSYFMYANSDGFLRKGTIASAKTALGLGSAAYTASTAYATSGHNHNSTYVRGTCKIVAGTVVRSVAAGATATVFTNAQLNTLLGVSNSTYANTVVYACNGDYGAQNHRIYSVDYITTGSRWDVRFGDNVAAGNYRYNYIVAYFG